MSFGKRPSGQDSARESSSGSSGNINKQKRKALEYKDELVQHLNASEAEVRIIIEH